MLYHHLCQWKIQSLYNEELYLLFFCQGYVQQDVHQFLIYWERDFLHYLNGELNLGVCSRIINDGKIPKSQREDAFSVSFCLLVKKYQ